MAAVLGLAVAACQGGGPPASTARATDEVPLPSITARPTAELPPLSIPARSPSAAPEESPSRPPRSEITLPTRAEAAIPTQDPPAPPSTTPAQAATTSADAPTSPAAPTSASAAPQAAPSSTSAPSWLWWLLGLLAVVAAVGIAVTVRARRAGEAWARQLSAVVAETTWLAHELLPNTLSSQDAAARLATWTAHGPRVESLTTSLNEVAAAAPPDRRTGVDQLRAAVFELRSAMDVYTTTPPPDDAESLGAVREAQRFTEEALRVVRRTPDSTPEEPVR